MFVSLTEEQRLLIESLERFRQQDYTFEKRRAHLKKLGAADDPAWSMLTEMGWLAATLPEEHGGLGGKGVDLGILMEQFGRALLTSAFVPSVVLGATALRAGGSSEQQAAYLPALAEGREKLALAYLENTGQHDPARVETRATRDGANYVIEGRKVAVLFGHLADHLLVSARTAQDLSLFLVPRTAAGIAIESYRLHDDGWAADIGFRNVRVPAGNIIGDDGKGLPILEAALDAGIAALCAEAVGIMWVMHDMTLDYIKVRKQFGATLGSFQALQHRMVNMYMKCQLAQSIAMAAIAALDSSDAIARGRAVSAAKAQIGRAARHVGEDAIQLHGGIAMTDEYAVGHYFKRLTMIRLTFGDEEFHLRRYRALGESTC
ncbi:MAG TPA: acyl-CoA dehydrogenase family protein [Dongiaceae bacterium]|nr:acyl-CoA dehydrogenase family protein [Dongiaceae bacterium]